MLFLFYFLLIFPSFFTSFPACFPWSGPAVPMRKTKQTPSIYNFLLSLKETQYIKHFTMLIHAPPSTLPRVCPLAPLPSGKQLWLLQPLACFQRGGWRIVSSHRVLEEVSTRLYGKMALTCLGVASDGWLPVDMVALVAYCLLLLSEMNSCPPWKLPVPNSPCLHAAPKYTSNQKFIQLIIRASKSRMSQGREV